MTLENIDDKLFYQDAQEYWRKIEPTVNGMLGGLECLANPDIKASVDFLKEFKKLCPSFQSEIVLDCGSGIGRVTKHFLQFQFQKVDLVEQSQHFLTQARNEYLKEEIISGKVGDLYCSGLQNFVPTENKYSAIWSQWVLGHLTDEDLVNFFIRCKKGLAKNGKIFIKENVAKLDRVLDQEDSSFTRSDKLLKEIFEKAGLKLILEKVQPNFPQGLYQVKMYALSPTQE